LAPWVTDPVAVIPGRFTDCPAASELLIALMSPMRAPVRVADPDGDLV
jgi:hypothetical protein